MDHLALGRGSRALDHGALGRAAWARTIRIPMGPVLVAIALSAAPVLATGIGAIVPAATLEAQPAACLAGPGVDGPAWASGFLSSMRDRPQRWLAALQARPAWQSQIGAAGQVAMALFSTPLDALDPGLAQALARQASAQEDQVLARMAAKGAWGPSGPSAQAMNAWLAAVALDRTLSAPACGPTRSRL